MNEYLESNVLIMIGLSDKAYNLLNDNKKVKLETFEKEIKQLLSDMRKHLQLSL